MTTGAANRTFSQVDASWATNEHGRVNGLAATGERPVTAVPFALRRGRFVHAVACVEGPRLDGLTLEAPNDQPVVTE